MLAIGARYTTWNVEPIPPDRKMWEGGCKYVNAAREVLSMPKICAQDDNGLIHLYL